NACELLPLRGVDGLSPENDGPLTQSAAIAAAVFRRGLCPGGNFLAQQSGRKESGAVREPERAICIGLGPSGLVLWSGNRQRCHAVRSQPLRSGGNFLAQQSGRKQSGTVREPATERAICIWSGPLGPPLWSDKRQRGRSSVSPLGRILLAPRNLGR